MTDVFDKNKRSEVMALVKSKNSKAELIAFRYLKQNGIYFQKHYAKVAGTPDIALPRKKCAVFIDGDFWHGRTLDKLKLRRPDPDDYWVRKITRNVTRDREQEALLLGLGWKILRVWESDIKRKSTRERTLQTIKLHLLNSSA